MVSSTLGLNPLNARIPVVLHPVVTNKICADIANVLRKAKLSVVKNHCSREDTVLSSGTAGHKNEISLEPLELPSASCKESQ